MRACVLIMQMIASLCYDPTVPVREALAGKVISYLEEKTNGNAKPVFKVVDIGCGTGGDIALLATKIISETYFSKSSAPGLVRRI